MKPGNTLFFSRINTFVACFVVCLPLFYVLQSCRDDAFELSPTATLSFSVDSLLFDTVFTTIGSSTRYFKIYNNHDKMVNISSIHLGRGVESFFKINVDGRSGNTFSNVVIGPNDSLFVFVEVTVDPLEAGLPILILDSVVFSVNNNLQNIKLVAWGQDANIIRPNRFDTVQNIQYHLITENTVWSGPKPYLIYGLLLVAPEVTLQVKEGTQVHLHNRSAMIFLERSTLRVEGSQERPVVFQGDRPEALYRDLPGQWGYIWLTATSRNHLIENAVIKNSTYGILLDSIGSFTDPTLIIRNTIVKNIDRVGLKLRGSHVVAENLVVANCGLHAIYLGLGGHYDFRHITMANYYWLDIRQTPSLILNNYYVDITGRVQIRNFDRVYFANSIFMGSLENEIGLDFYSGAPKPDFKFDHSLIRTTLQHQHRERFMNCLFGTSAHFRNTRANDFRLNENSPAIGAGDSIISLAIPLDIIGNSRANRSDMGAYQFQELPAEKP